MVPCPSDEQLLAFLVDESAASLDSMISQHIDTCSSCLSRLEVMTAAQDCERDRPSPSVMAATTLMARLMDSAPTHEASDLPPTEPRFAPTHESWPQLPGYEILEELGRGGMGVVYKARQHSLNRVVALKLMLAGAGTSTAVHSRFHTEAEAAARLHHPNIVQIFAIGEHKGWPYIALEYVEGETLAQRLKETPQRPTAAAALVEILARAIHAAHEQGIVHRDLKPSNILLKSVRTGIADDRRRVRSGDSQLTTFRPADSRGSSNETEGRGSTTQTSRVKAEGEPTYGIPKIADFGLAKLIDDSNGFTRTGDLIGTPCYIAPEQVVTTSRRSGNQGSSYSSDIYSLGVILYEMLTGRPPFKGETSVDTLLQVLHQDPVSPSRLQPRVQPDLATICLKCLEKTPGNRYESALALAEDLHRFCVGEPILARRVGPVGQARRWCRRRPALAASMAALAMSLALGFLATSFLWLRAEESRRHAETSAEHAKAHVYLGSISQAQLEWRLNNPAGASALLTAGIPRPGEPDRRGWEWYYLQNVVHGNLLNLVLDRARSTYVTTVQFSRDGRYLMASGGDYFRRAKPSGALHVWDLTRWNANGEPTLAREVLDPGSFLRAMDFSDDGRLLAYGGSTGVVSLIAGGLQAEPRTLGEPRRAINHISVSPDGARVAAADAEGMVQVTDVRSGKLQFQVEGRTVEFLGGGERLLTSGVHGPDGSVQLVTWDANDGRRIASIGLEDQGFARSPDGGSVVTWRGSEARVIDLLTGKGIATFAGHEGGILQAAFSPDGLFVATAGADRSVRLWNARTGLEELVLRGHRSRVISVAFHPSGRYLASGGQGEGEVKVWDLTRQPEHLTIGGIPIVPRPTARFASWGHPTALAFTADSRRMVAAHEDLSLSQRDTFGGPELHSIRPLDMNNEWLVPSKVAVFSADGSQLAFVARKDTTRVMIRETKDGGRIVDLAGHTVPVVAIAWSRDGRRLVTAGIDWRQTGLRREIRVWDTRTAALLAEFRPIGIAASASRHPLYGTAALNADGSLLAFDEYPSSGSADRAAVPRVIVHDVRGNRPRWAFEGHNVQVRAIAFSGDGQLLASGDQGGRIFIHDLGTGRPLHGGALSGPSESLGDLAFSPDDRLLAAVDREQVQIWHPRLGQQVLALRGAPPRQGDNAFNSRVTWSPDGRLLAAVAHDSMISVWQGSQPLPAQDRLAEAERRAFAWHLAHGLLAISLREADYASTFHLRCLTESTPPNDELRAERGRLFARMGAWQEAVRDLKANRLLRSSWQFLELASIQLLAGDEAGYRETTREMFEEFAENRSSSGFEYLARTLQLGQAEPAQLERMHLLAAPDGPVTLDSAGLLGGSLYRLGRYAEALEVLERVSASDNPARPHIRLSAFLCMANARLGRIEAARLWLERLERRNTGQEGPDPGRPRELIPKDLAPSDWLELLLLRAEARKTLREAESSKPAG